MVDLFGDQILKLTLALFMVMNIQRFITFSIKTVYNRLFLAFFGSALLSFFVNYDSISDIQFSIISIVAMFGYYVIFSKEHMIKHVLWAVVISLAVSSIYCIVRPDTITPYTFRKTGGTGDPNEFSTLLMIGVGLLWGYYLDFKRHIIPIIIVGLLFVVAILFAGSKSALLALAMLLLIGSYLIVRESKNVNKVKSLIIFTGIIILSFFLLNYYFGDVIDLYIERFANQSSSAERFKSWSSGFTLFYDNPIFGVGPTNYSHAVGNEYYFLIAESSQEAHNMLIKALVETGLVGFLAFILLIVIPLKNAVVNRQRFTINLMIVGLFVMGLTLSLTFEKYTWLVLGLIQNKYSIKNDKVQPTS